MPTSPATYAADSFSSGNSLPSPSTPDSTKRRVTYFYEPSIGDYYYGQGHPMKPHRIRMAHNLVVHYHLHRFMDICRPFPASAADIRRFHSDDYVDFLASVTPQFLAAVSDDGGVHPFESSSVRQLRRFNVGEDCPVFEGLFEFCQASAGGSIGAAVKINRGDADIAINWAGGLHHAKKCEASGFCYVNDIVLGILELLKFHKFSLGRLSSQTASITAKKRVRDPKLLRASTAPLLKHSAEYMMEETSDHIGLNLFCGGHDVVTIYGYWMGPDLEDGWGFLEASINHIHIV